MSLVEQFINALKATESQKEAEEVFNYYVDSKLLVHQHELSTSKVYVFSDRSLIMEKNGNLSIANPEDLPDLAATVFKMASPEAKKMMRAYTEQANYVPDYIKEILDSE